MTHLVIALVIRSEFRASNCRPHPTPEETTSHG